jgi:transposase
MRRKNAPKTSKPHTRSRPARSATAQILATRLHRYESELFEFIRTLGVSPTNNLAERAVRPQVIVRKISVGSRSLAGSQIRCDLATIVHTWVARGRNPFKARVEARQTP